MNIIFDLPMNTIQRHYFACVVRVDSEKRITEIKKQFQATIGQDPFRVSWYRLHLILQYPEIFYIGFENISWYKSLITHGGITINIRINQAICYST